MPVEKYQKNRCDREKPDCFPRGIGADCWTPKQLKKYGISAAEVGPDQCVEVLKQEHDDMWYNCMQKCFTNAYGTAGSDRAGERESEERKKKEQEERKKKEDLERSLRGEPVKTDATTENRTESPPPSTASTEEGPKSRSGRKKTTQKQTNYQDTIPVGVVPSAVRVLWLCREKCGRKVETNFRACYCDQVRCGPEEEEFPEEITIGIGDDKKPVADGPTDPTGETPVDEEDTFEDIRYTVSEYGVPIERPYGLTGVSGNIIWAGPGINARSATFALALGDARTDFVRRVWFNDTLIYAKDAATATFGTFVGGDTELVADKLYFYKGGPDALPIAEMGEVQIGYRDLSLLLFKDFDVVVDNQFPRIRVEIADGAAEVGVTARAVAPLFTPTRVSSFGTDMIALYEGALNRLQIMTADGNTLYSESGINTVDATLIDPSALIVNRASSINSYYFDGAANTTAAPPATYDLRGPVDIIANIKSPAGATRSTLVTAIGNSVQYHQRVNAVFDATPFATFPAVLPVNVRWIAEVTGLDGTMGLYIAPVSGLPKFTAAAVKHVGISGVGPRTGDTVDAFEIDYPLSLTAAAFETVFTSGTNIVFVGRMSGGLAAFAWSYVDKAVKWAAHIPARAPLGNGRYGAGRSVGGMIIVASTANIVALNTSTGAVVYDEPILTSGAHVQISTNEIYVGGKLYALQDSVAANTSAGRILANEMALAGYAHDEYDVSDVDTVSLRGYKISARGSLAAFMQELADTALIVVDTANGYVTAVRQATQFSTPQINVPGEVLSEGTKETRFYLAAQRVASEVAVTYVAEESRLEIQTATYRDDARATFRYVFTTNATMTESEARNLAEYMASTVVEDGDEIKFRVGPAYIALTPGTVLSYAVGGTVYNWSVKTADIGADLSVDVTLRRVFTPSLVSLPSASVTDPAVTPVVYKNGVARPVILNVRPVGSAQVPTNGALKVYAVVKGEDVGETALIKWRNGRYASRALVAGPVLSGTLLNTPVLPFDTYVSQNTESDQLVVRFDRDVSADTFADDDYVSAVAGDSEYRNMLLLGKEWVQFGALIVSPDNRTVTFTQVARGMRGTETEISNTIAGVEVYLYSFSTFGEFTYSEREVATGAAVISATNTEAKVIVRDTVETGLSMLPSWPWPITNAKAYIRTPSQMVFEWYPRSFTAVGLDDDTFTSRYEVASGTFAIIVAGGPVYDEAMLRADVTAVESGKPLVHGGYYVIVQNATQSAAYIDKYLLDLAGLDWNTDILHISVAELPSASFFADKIGGIYTTHTFAPATLLPLRQQIVTIQ